MNVGDKVICIENYNNVGIWITRMPNMWQMVGTLILKTNNMLDTIKKWWNRKWSNWEFDSETKVFETELHKRPNAVYEVHKRISNDGIVEFKKIKKY